MQQLAWDYATGEGTAEAILQRQYTRWWCIRWTVSGRRRLLVGGSDLTFLVRGETAFGQKQASQSTKII